MEDYNVSPELIEEQEKQLNSKNEYKRKFEFDEKNYLNLRLNPGEVKKQIKIRILPVSAEDKRPVLVLHTHSLKVSPEISKSGFKSFICLNDEHLRDSHPEGCPLCQKSEELLEEARSITDPVQNKAVFKSAMSYKSKKTLIARVIERGHESEGVKFWRFNAHSNGTGYYDQLLHLYNIRKQESLDATGETYNIFDLKNGRDIIITLTYDPNTKKTSGTIADAGFNSPLSTDAEQVAAWVNDKKKWSDIYASKTYDYLKIVADGCIPYYNKEDGKWEAKKEIENNSFNTDTPVMDTFDTATTETEPDLPF